MWRGFAIGLALKQGLDIASLRRLRVGPPVTAFDVLQFCFVDFIVSEYFDRFQVRVAGWNIRWNDIPKREQDGFIRRLEALPR